MKLKRVRIQNYRSIKMVDFVPTTLCALIGGNNSGKSNVLRAINFVLGDRWPGVSGIEDRDFHGYDETKDIVISLWFDTARTVRGDIGDPMEFTGIQFTATRYKRASGRHSKGDLKSEFICIDDNGEPVKILRRAAGGGFQRPHPEPAKVSEEIRSATPAVMVDVDRNAKQHLSGSQWSILGRMLHGVSKDLKSDSGRYSQFQKKFSEARELLHTKQYLRMHESIVCHLESHTGIKGVEITLDQIDPINLYKSFSVLFKDPETPQFVDADRMGSGIQSAVVISLLQAYRELHKTDAILLFEEPELFLHPHGRRHLFRLLCDLAKNDTQVLYTTHSQDFVDLTRIDDVQLVSKTCRAGTELRPPKTKPLTDEARKKLKIIKHFSSPRNEVFFARTVVLVEGVTEQAIISCLAGMRTEPLELDQLNCSIIEVGGKENLPLFIRMMLALDKKVLVVYDTDGDQTSPTDIATNEKRRNDISEALCGRGVIFECDPCVESLAQMTEPRRRDKDERMREHLSQYNSWDEIPDGLKSLIETVAEIACEKDAI